MGRTVSYPKNCIARTYIDTSELSMELETELDKRFEWEKFVESLKLWFQDNFSHMDEPRGKKWLGRENKILLEGQLFYVGISEYAGLSCIWVAEKDYMHEGKRNLAYNHGIRLLDKFNKEHDTLRKKGTFSNGNAIYEKR